MSGDDDDDDDNNNNNKNRANHRRELLYRLNTMQTERHARDAFHYTSKRTVYERAESRHEEEEEEKQKKRKMIKLMVMKCRVSFRKLASSV